jgi:hypothetical protein
MTEKVKRHKSQMTNKELVIVAELVQNHINILVEVISTNLGMCEGCVYQMVDEFLQYVESQQEVKDRSTEH